MKCGGKLHEKANFCVKCGAKSVKEPEQTFDQATEDRNIDKIVEKKVEKELWK